MTLLHFLFTFTIMILLSCPAIIGWYVITRGEWYPRPDGTWKKYGMIFKEWSLLWEQYRWEKAVFYTNEELRKKFEFLQKVRPDLAEKMSPIGDSISVFGMSFSRKDIEQMEDVLSCSVICSSPSEIRLYVKEPVYVFPSWVRKPLSECPTCMASAYGSIIYWFVVLNGPSGFFAWAVKENLAKFGFWVIFCLILACGNKYLEQKLKL